MLGGTSAGANIVSRPPRLHSSAETDSIEQAAALGLKLRDENALDGVVGQLLNIPVLCHPRFFPHGEHELRSYEQNAQSPTINGERMRWFWGNFTSNYFEDAWLMKANEDQYFPNATPDTRASPLLARRFDGLPPACMYFQEEPPVDTSTLTGRYSDSSCWHGPTPR